MTTLILGLLIGAGFVFLYSREEVKLKWFDWVLLSLAMVFFLLAIVNFSASRAELEPKAANILLVSFGLPGLVLAAIVAVRAWRSREALTE